MATDIAQKAHKAWWEKCCHDDADVSYEDAFLAGYTRGRADAMEMPEVRAEDLVRGEAYLMRSVGAREWSFYRCEKVGAFIGSKVCFRGPLRFGEGK